MWKINLILILPVFTITLFGCAITSTIPTPSEIVSTPLGTESIKLGMSKEKVESLWGKPDTITMEEGKDSFHNGREVWFYRAAPYGGIVPPINAGYLSSARRLYFDGNNLVEIK